MKVQRDTEMWHCQMGCREVTRDYKFMRCGGSNGEKGVKFIKKKKKIEKEDDEVGR